MTQPDSFSAFADCLAFEGRLRVAVTRRPAPSDEVRRQRLEELNSGVLTAVEALEERRSDNVEDDGPIGRELSRIEARLDVLTELLNRTLVPDDTLPPQRQVRFNAIGISITGAKLPAEAGPLAVRIHFDACRALPLELDGHAIGTAAPGFIAFDQPGDTVRDGIERLVFRLHRRAIAGSRQRLG